MSTELRILIAGGGTGGHLYPGLALAEELRARGAAVTFAGTERGIEAKAVPQAGYPLELIDVQGLKGQGFFGTLRSALRVPGALLQARALLKRLSPQVVVGVGGYASGPVVLGAAARGIPTVVLEQNSVPGLTNRMLARVAKAVITAFPQAAQHFPAGKVQPLGNPVRTTLLRSAVTEAAPRSGPLQVLVLGGSQGAKAVNELCVQALAHWQAAPPGNLPLAAALRLRHQTGKSDFPATQQRYEALGLPAGVVTVNAFIDDMGRAYAACELVVGRAGATTIAELTAVGRPALLIPFPFAADDHQTENARSLVEHGAAELLVQKDAKPEQLAAALQRLCRDRAALRRMAEQSRSLGRPQAAAEIAAYVLSLAKP